MLFLIVGDAKAMKIPPPSYCELKVADPFWRVKPFNTELDVSFEENVNTGAIPPPSIIVTLAPPELLRVIAFPEKLMFSLYVPGETRTVSPLLAALIPA